MLNVHQTFGGAAVPVGPRGRGAHRDEPPGLERKARPVPSPLARLATLDHLRRPESEGIHLLREVAAEAENPVMLYSIGKDGSVMPHLARKAFYPAPVPFPLLHVDTTWKVWRRESTRSRTAWRSTLTS